MLLVGREKGCTCYQCQMWHQPNMKTTLKLSLAKQNHQKWTGGKCKTGKCGTILHGWNMQDVLVGFTCLFVLHIPPVHFDATFSSTAFSASPFDPLWVQ